MEEEEETEMVSVRLLASIDGGARKHQLLVNDAPVEGKNELGAATSSLELEVDFDFFALL